MSCGCPSVSVHSLQLELWRSAEYKIESINGTVAMVRIAGGLFAVHVEHLGLGLGLDGGHGKAPAQKPEPSATTACTYCDLGNGATGVGVLGGRCPRCGGTKVEP